MTRYSCLFALLFVCLGAASAQTTATPSISLATGTYAMPQNTTLSDSTNGATIYWCYTGTGTCSPSAKYTGGNIYVDPATTETICAFATATGYSQSATACAYYTTATAATPAIALATGTYGMPQSTSISDSTGGASIEWCYTGAGTCTPNTAYSGSIYVDPATTETICADATASGYQASAARCNYYTTATAATPAISLATGTYTMPQNTKISDLTQGASIQWCYTGTGDCTPNTSYSNNQSIYVDPSTTETICASATASGYQASATVCNEYTNSDQSSTATPAISLATGSYVMPQNTTISDSTQGASIEWCYTGTGTCTPNTSYSGSIYVDPTSTETICANATASGYKASQTTCNYYTATSSGNITFSYSNNQVSISTSLQNATIFYTMDGSKATEASIEYSQPFTASPGMVINAVAVEMSNNGNSGVAIQNGQQTPNNWKTNVACHEPSQLGGQSAAATQCPYSDVENSYNTPHLNYCSDGTDNTTDQGCQGVQGIPTQIAMTAGPIGTSENLNFTDAGLYPGSTDYGTQVLWPYNAGSVGCDTCTNLVEDFYLWGGQNATAVENWELDMNDWVTATSPNVYRGASMQCSINDGSWDYNGQDGDGISGWGNKWVPFSHWLSSGYDHDCPLPTGSITAALNTTSCSFSVAPNQETIIEPGMILWFNGDGTNEEIMVNAVSGNSVTACHRGYGNTTASAHDSGATYSGSVHVQYHVTIDPGNTGCTDAKGNTVECMYIDYLTVNNFDVFNKATYGSQISFPATTIQSTYPDRIFDQKQIDMKADPNYVDNPIQVGEYVDQDNVTASFGVLASQSYTVPNQ
ncbi:MAG TPA: chitobiase/beta-hexosaminidase C-terminal domain-containing protein [Acidobacteriaceae bacterium]|nr:chitobiase/beta-hexosaminidase C-terminal domain-containing protein [Acidobacteriaceae bacterium]